MDAEFKKHFLPEIETGFDFEAWLKGHGFVELEGDEHPENVTGDKVYRKDLYDSLYVRIIDRRPAHQDIEIFTAERIDTRKEFWDTLFEDIRTRREPVLLNMISCILPQNSPFAHQLFAHIFTNYKDIAKQKK